jgi:phytoene synthase
LTVYSYDPQSLENHGKSFYWASFFLPNKNKDAASELYSICRYFDDLADETSTDQSEKLKEEFEQICNRAEHPINKFFKNNNISIQVLGDLIKGLIKDQKLVRIQTERDLIEYSYQVAGTVGLMMQPLILVNNKEANKHAVDLGIAMQLTNIARDVYEDATMNRVYLPKEWLKDISIEQLTSSSIQQIQSQMSIIIKKLIDLSEVYYQNGFSGMKYIPIKTRLAIFFAAKIYRGIGMKIKSNQYQYSNKRVYLNKFNKLWVTIKSLPEFIFLKRIYRSYTPIRESFQNENL